MKILLAETSFPGKSYDHLSHVIIQLATVIINDGGYLRQLRAEQRRNFRVPVAQS
jgi:hypothetical protein